MTHSNGLGLELRETAGASRPAVAPVEIVLAYRQAVVRSGLRMLLNGVTNFVVTAEARDADAALAFLMHHPHRVLVLDLDALGVSSVAGIQLIRKASPETRIVVMSVRQDSAFVRQATASGALGYVPSTASAHELTEAVRRASSGLSYLSPTLGAVATGQPAPSGPSELSSREIEVLRLIALGYTNPEVAERLFLSVRTIETHRSHIRHKLDRATRAELVEYAFAHGLGGSG